MDKIAVLGLAGRGVWWLKEHQPSPTGPPVQAAVSTDPADPNIASAGPAPASTSPVVVAAASATVADPVLPPGRTTSQNSAWQIVADSYRSAGNNSKSGRIEREKKQRRDAAKHKAI